MESIKADMAVGALSSALHQQQVGADLITKTLEGSLSAPPVDQDFQKTVLAAQGVGQKMDVMV